MNIEIANRLVELRKKSGLSQEELAAKLGLSRQAVSKWERAEASPDTDNLICLAKLYGVSLDALLNTDESIEDIVKESATDSSPDVKPNPEETAKTEANEQPHAEEKEEPHADKASFEDKGHANSDGGGEYVHIDPDGIHVYEKNGDEVHIDGGIHIKTKGDGSGVTYTKTYHSHGWHLAEDLVASITSVLCVTAYLCMGLFYPDPYIGWGVSWLIFFLVPLNVTFVTALRHKKFSDFAFPVLVAGVYIMLGMVWKMWGTTWPIFFAIPLYYIIFGPIDNFIHRHDSEDEKDDDEHDDDDIIDQPAEETKEKPSDTK
jgi:transcriptional regulator with XRE-family HTH domain